MFKNFCRKTNCLINLWPMKVFDCWCLVTFVPEAASQPLYGLLHMLTIYNGWVAFSA